MVVNRPAATTILLWLAVSLALLPAASRLEDRLVYSEEHLVPEDIESRKAVEVLRGIGMAPGSSYIIVAYNPVGLESSRTVESKLEDILDGWDPIVIGPWSMYTRVLGEARARLAGVLINSLEAYMGLKKLAENAVEAYTGLRSALNATYGTAQAYMIMYSLARATGSPSPSEEAYETLRGSLPAEARPFLDEFYKSLYGLTGGRPSLWAVEEAARASAYKLLPYDMASLVAEFSLANYTSSEAVMEVLYRRFSEYGVNISLDEFKMLVRDPVGAPRSIVILRLSDAPPCLVDAFDLTLQGYPVAEAVDATCRGYLEATLPFPDAIPEEYRGMLVSGGYGFVYAYTRVPVEVNESISIMERLHSGLSGVDAYYYGSIPLLAEVATSAERETARIDVATVILVTILLVALMGSVTAPAVILAGASASLAVSMGLLSIAAGYTGVYYLSRILVIPVVFGITVDYSVFYLFRVLEEYRAGKPWGAAVATAWRRASRALTLGGIAVVLGFAAYILTPQEALRGIGIALVIAAGVSFASSMTLLPAILALLGPRLVFWPRRRLDMPAAGQALFFRRIASRSIRHDTLVTLSMIVATLVLALYLAHTPPSANIYFSLPRDSQYIEAARILDSALPSWYYSRIIVVAPSDVDLEGVTSIIEELGLRVLDTASRGGYTILNIGLPIDPLDDRIYDILTRLRTSLPPGVMVDGFPSLRADAVESILGDFFKITLPLASLLILSYLVIGYGSVLVPLRLLATIAFSTVVSLAFAMITFEQEASRISVLSFMRSSLYWVVPIIVLGLMITLGMDYDIFLTTRIREELGRGKREDEAILEAVERTGVVITVCGIILAGAFSTLLLTRVPTLREAGLAIALSILIDTFIVRPVLVPAVMTVLGRYNWWPGKSLFREWD